MEREQTKGTWVLALRENGVGYLGRVDGLDGAPSMREQGTFEADDVLEAKTVRLSPAYDYREVVKDIPILGQNGKMQQDPNIPGLPAMQPMRTPLVMPVGFTAEHAPIHIRAQRYDFRFLTEMHPNDARTLTDFADATDRMMLEMRAHASGLSLSGSNELEALRTKRGI